MAFGVKGPLVYTSVAIRDWTAFEKLGVSYISSPTMYHSGVGLDEAVSEDAVRKVRALPDVIQAKALAF